MKSSNKFSFEIITKKKIYKMKKRVKARILLAIVILLSLVSVNLLTFVRCLGLFGPFENIITFIVMYCLGIYEGWHRELWCWVVARLRK